jgi:PKD repeat protein
MSGCRPRPLLLLVYILVFAFNMVSGGIINVPVDQPSIQAGIDAATSLIDTVLVAPGIYPENIIFNGKLIVVSSHFLFDSDPQYIFNTVIDGGSPSHPDTGSCVRIVHHEDENAVLQGFTLTNGTGTRWLDPHGAGIFREGGGVLCEYSSPVIQYNYIVENDAMDRTGAVSTGGGGIRSGDGDPQIRNNIIMYNRARYGSAIVLNYCQGTISNNVIAYNSGGQDYSGASVWKLSSYITTIENNTIVGNISTSSCGGVYNWGASAFMTLRNNIIWGNIGNISPQIRNNGGTIFINNCDVEGGYAGDGNIDTDPQFVGSYFYLAETSPCIDAGEDNVIYHDPEDGSSPGSAQWPALGSLRNDMGAYGGQGSFSFEHIVIYVDTTFGFAPLTVNFSGASIYAVDSWTWNLGEGDPVYTRATQHTYETPGMFDISLEVNSGGETYFNLKNDYIQAIADSLVGNTVGSRTGSSTAFPIAVRNIVPLRSMIIPVEYSGDLNLVYDSFSTAGCRAEYFEIQELMEEDTENKRMILELTSSESETSPDMEPGYGEVVKIYFTIQPSGSTGEETTVELDGWTEENTPKFTFETRQYFPRFANGLFYLAYICGDANGDEGVNIGDVVYITNHVFRNGECPVNPPIGCPPVPYESGDVNCDESVNIGDAVYLGNVIFRPGSPLPCAGCP